MRRTNRKCHAFAFNWGWKMVRGIFGSFNDVLNTCGVLFTDAILRFYFNYLFFAKSLFIRYSLSQYLNVIKIYKLNVYIYIIH